MKTENKVDSYFENSKFNKTEAILNAKLIAEAGNVYNECGFTPRQLLEQRNEMLKSLESTLKMLQVYACIAETVRNEAVLAIKKATE